ncbi:GNAT family N-acetyltransferase [Alteraurantiacibacter aestuarii]|uniref:GNAT family N-acetyltransferase n=1 Tax=Alteraurantiacibacter aestuarii TaxID=650004 RepID=A0A844ZNJ8_9SPHN|nr:GNAT family N-acetyltransferase [Alteraurantiacibacter aestuarii]MXO88407.1 GNAT family N-acetyltransferase [Alteraurantiacibacter aestuarii]
MRLVTPTRAHLPSYIAALERGWSPNNMDSERHRLRELAEIADDADSFLASMTDREAKAGDVQLPDGSFVKRLPGIRKWMWEDSADSAGGQGGGQSGGEFCGQIGFRWMEGTEALPPHLLGHIGYGVVPWRRGRAYAAQAVRDILPEARALGMRWVTITTDHDNPASLRTIARAGGYHTGTAAKPAAYRHGDTIEWFRIDL